eukprot:TRINITY_DN8344_c0_g1_i1.p1 TRINITY_DN8344_c0_g1~~TRINITY_DN8344_c0_g1_i1.p1  ORF type:complete len:1222 (-),score=356.38 TRINITY_DN8344_c0_g1_i1:140-3805(-)
MDEGDVAARALLMDGLDDGDWKPPVKRTGKLVPSPPLQDCFPTIAGSPLQYALRLPPRRRRAAAASAAGASSACGGGGGGAASSSSSKRSFAAASASSAGVRNPLRRRSRTDSGEDEPNHEALAQEKGRSLENLRGRLQEVIRRNQSLLVAELPLAPPERRVPGALLGRSQSTPGILPPLDASMSQSHQGASASLSRSGGGSGGSPDGGSATRSRQMLDLMTKLMREKPPGKLLPLTAEARRRAAAAGAAGAGTGATGRLKIEVTTSPSDSVRGGDSVAPTPQPPSPASPSSTSGGRQLLGRHAPQQARSRTASQTVPEDSSDTGLSEEEEDLVDMGPSWGVPPEAAAKSEDEQEDGHLEEEKASARDADTQAPPAAPAPPDDDAPAAAARREITPEDQARLLVEAHDALATACDDGRLERALQDLEEARAAAAAASAEALGEPGVAGTSAPDDAGADDGACDGSAAAAAIAAAGRERLGSAELQERQEKERLQVFWRLAIDCEIPVDQLARALQLLGHAKPRADWVDDFVQRMFNGRSNLEKEEFLEFMSAYQARFNLNMSEMFHDLDRDKSGYLAPGEVHRLLRELEISPVTTVVEELVMEVTGEEQPANAKLYFDQFVSIYNLVYIRSGFTRRESDYLKSVFQRYDRDADGRITALELQWCMRWMGFVTTQEQVDTLVKQVSAKQRQQSSSDESECHPVAAESSIDEKEFFTLMRSHREEEVAQVLTAFSHADSDVDGTVVARQLPDIFAELGFSSARPEVLWECAEHVGVASKGELLFEDLYSLLDDFRRVDGFLASELSEISLTFDRFASADGNASAAVADVADAIAGVGEGDGADDAVPAAGSDGDGRRLGGVALSAAARWLGYTQKGEHLRDALEEYDLDGNGALSLEEFRKLLRMFTAQNVTKIRDAFLRADDNHNGTLSVGELRNVLLRMGHAATRAEVEELLAQRNAPQRSAEAANDEVGEKAAVDDGAEEAKMPADEELSLWPFVELVERCRMKARDDLRANQGFTANEVRHLEGRFRKYDEGSVGTIRNRQVAKLLEELLPDSRYDQQAHHRARELFGLGDLDSDGIINFQDFLRMMRSLQDEQDSRKLEEEQEAIEACGYKRSEVAEFRSIFEMFDQDFDSQLNYGDFESMFRGLVPMGNKAMKELHGLLAEADKDGDRRLSFPEYLRAMRKLQEENWNNIGGLNAEQQPTEQEEKSEKVETNEAVES